MSETGKLKAASTPSEALTKLAEAEKWEVRWAVSQNPSTPPEVLARLAEDESIGVRKNVASNPYTPPEVLKKLATLQKKEGTHDEIMVRLSINRSTPTEALAQLIETENTAIKFNVASNSNASPETLNKLAEEGREVVSSRIVANRNTSTETLNLIVKQNLSTRCNYPIAKHPNVSGETLFMLTKNSDILVVFKATQNPKLHTYLHHRAVQDGICSAGQPMPLEWLKQIYI